MASCCKVKAGEGAQLSHREGKQPDKEVKPAEGPKERNLQMQNHLWSTVKSLSRHEFYHLINLCLDSL